MKRLTIAASTIVVLMLIAGCGMSQAHDEIPGYGAAGDEQPSMLITSGSSPDFSPGELYELADLVVMGSSTAYTLVQKKVAEERTYPDHLKEDHADHVVDVRVHSFEVDRYIKGEGPDVIEVMTIAGTGDPENILKTGGDILEIKESTTYVLYLYQPLDREFWGQRYFIEGGQGLWKISVNEDSGLYTATQELFSGDQVPLQTLIESRTGTPQSNEFKTKWDASVKEINEGSGEGPTGNVND